MNTLTSYQEDKINRAIKQTEKLLQKELAYSFHLQNKEYIEELKEHTTKLLNMLPA